MGARPQQFHTYDVGEILSFLKHMPVSNVIKEIRKNDTKITESVGTLTDGVSNKKSNFK